MFVKSSIIFVVIVAATYGQQQFLPIQLLLPVELNHTNITGLKPIYYNSLPIRQNETHNNASYPNINRYNSTKLNNTINNTLGYAVNSVSGPSSNGRSNGSEQGHLFVGQIGLIDRLLFSQTYRKEGRWWSNREKVIEYPTEVKSGYLVHETISAIRIYNQFLDGNSAKATILKGGIGYQYVKIKLESKWKKGFQYLVQIYGH